MKIAMFRCFIFMETNDDNNEKENDGNKMENTTKNRKKNCCFKS